jgi:hypothetical protein
MDRLDMPDPSKGSLATGTRAPSRVVYSALIGNYEMVLPRHVEPEDDIDFLFLTDSPNVDPGRGWKIVEIEPRFARDSVRSARRIKIRGHEALAGYEQTLWLDNRVKLKGKAQPLFDLLRDKDLVLPKHSYREKLAEEFSEVIRAGYDDPRAVREMYRMARDCGVLDLKPFWTGMMLRKANAEVRECMEHWFELLLLTTRRDQLSINVALKAASSRLRVGTLDIDNLSSSYHEWLALAGLNRRKAVQLWRPARRSLALTSADVVRSTSLGRKSGRVLSKLGYELPTLPA